MTTTTIPLPRNLLPKPSDALYEMIEALWEADKDINCSVEMGTTGYLDDGVRCGCAATFTVWRLAKAHNFFAGIPGYQRREQLPIEWRGFERMINALRQGNWAALLKFYGVPLIRPHMGLAHMDRRNWRQKLPDYEAYHYQLKQLGH